MPDIGLFILALYRYLFIQLALVGHATTSDQSSGFYCLPGFPRKMVTRRLRAAKVIKSDNKKKNYNFLLLKKNSSSSLFIQKKKDS